MAEEKQLFAGTLRKIHHRLTEDGCPIKTTGQLCQEFKILYQFPEKIEEFAQTYELERTVKVKARHQSPPQNDRITAEEEAAIAAAEQAPPDFDAESAPSGKRFAAASRLTSRPARKHISSVSLKRASLTHALQRRPLPSSRHPNLGTRRA